MIAYIIVWQNKMLAQTSPDVSTTHTTTSDTITSPEEISGETETLEVNEYTKFSLIVLFIFLKWIFGNFLKLSIR